jgi:hypothetical protein
MDYSSSIVKAISLFLLLLIKNIGLFLPLPPQSQLPKNKKE